MAPTLIASYLVQRIPAGSADFVTSSFTPTDGEVLVVKLATWNTNVQLGVPSGGGQTFTSRANVPPSGFYPWVGIYTAIVSGSPGSMTVTSTPPSSIEGSMVVERWSGATLAASPAVGTSAVNDVSSTTVTTTATNSVVSWVACTFNTTNPSGRTYVGTPTEEGLRSTSTSSNGNDFHCYQAAAVAGSQSFGLTNPSTAEWALAGIEIKASASTVTGTAAAALGALASTAAGTPTVTGTGTTALGALAAAASGTPTVLGGLAATLGVLTGAATGTVTITGTAADDLGILTGAATGTVTTQASLRPTNELVAVAWLRHVTGETTVATDVPADNSSWSASGFVQVQAAGGTPDNYVPVAQPVLSIDCWAVKSGSNKPPWFRANARAEVVRAAVLDHGNVPYTVTTLPAAYSDARVLSAVMLTEPRRIPSDDVPWAHYQFDIQLWWVEVTA